MVAMKTVRFDLYDEYALVKGDGKDGALTAFLHEDGVARPAMIIIPGGGYTFLAYDKCLPVVEPYFKMGFNCFMLSYSLAPNAYPVQLAEAVMAVDLIRTRAKELGVDGESIAVIGFSAGGHLAASLATIGCDKRVEEYVGSGLNAAHRTSILIYPVISMEEDVQHTESAQNVSGGDDEIKQYLSVEKHVNATTPPTFVAHAITDEVVSSMNSLRYAEALSRAGVRFELHVFPAGKHGMVFPEMKDYASRRWSEWLDLTMKFLQGQGYKME